MGKVTISIPLVTWRDGRPRFIPGRQARAEGWTGEDLRHGETGPWFTLDEAIAWSARRQRDMDSRRQDQQSETPAPAQTMSSNSVAHLIKAWQKSPAFRNKVWSDGRKRRKPLAPKTIHFYHYNSGILQKRFPDIWAAPAAALTPAIVNGLFETLEEERGIATARAVIATLRRALSWGRLKFQLYGNAAKDLHLPMAEPRVRAASIAEVRCLVITADAIGRPDLADMILFAALTGQRQGDRIAMLAHQIVDNRITLQQSKRGKQISIKVLPILAIRLRAAMARRAARTVQYPHLFLNELDNKPWTADLYRKKFRQLRTAAAAGVMGANGKWISPPCQSLEDLTDQDLKDTNQTWLANASATDVEMAATAGHSEATAAQTRKHYVAINATQADNAMDKLSSWLAGEGAKF